MNGLDILPEAVWEMDDREFEQWVRLLERRLGLTVPEHRKPFLLSGLRRRMRETRFSRFRDYHAYLSAANGAHHEWAALVDNLTVHETNFFRHPPSLAWIGGPWLSGWQQGAHEAEALHALSIGCSTGEEVWSLAMVLDHAMQASERRRRFGIIGNDISNIAIQTARQATYSKDKLMGIPEPYRSRYTTATGDGRFEISPELRRRASFACTNGLEAAWASIRKLDLIYCQNVLIYLMRERRMELLDSAASLLRPGGILVVGPGEATGWTHPLLQRDGTKQVTAFRKVTRWN